MKLIQVLRMSACALVLAAASTAAAQTSNVMLSMNVFPTSLANPNGGGTWEMVAKTDSPLGICGISAYLMNVNTVGIGIESDLMSIANGGVPYNGVFGTAVNVVFGYDLSTGPIQGGVGTPSFSDGPDPLGDIAWNDATRIFTGTYGSTAPSFATNVGVLGLQSDANVFAQLMLGVPALNADTTTVVRVAVPEPATIALAAAALGTVGRIRRRR